MALLITYAFPGDDGDPWDPAVFPIIRNPRDPNPTPTIEDGWGRMVTGNTLNCNIVAFTEPVLADLELTVKYRPDPSNNDLFVELGYRIGTNIETGDPTDGYLVTLHPAGNGMRLYTITGGENRLSIGNDNFAGINDFEERFVKVKVRGDRHQVKWWTASGDEPPGWKIDLTDTAFPAAGRSFIRMFNSDSAVNFVDFDSFRLQEVAPPDPGLRVGANPVVGLYYVDDDLVAHPATACYYVDDDLVAHSVPVPEP